MNSDYGAQNIPLISLIIQLIRLIVLIDTIAKGPAFADGYGGQAMAKRRRNY